MLCFYSLFISLTPWVEKDGLSQNAEAKKANPDNFLDSSVVKTLEDQGFLRQIGMQK